MTPTTDKRPTRPLPWLATTVLALLGAFAAASCSLDNIDVDDCQSDDECVLAFGLGSSCNDGFCSAPASCQTGHDCRKAFGGGACVNHQCVDNLPLHPDCFVFEPEALTTSRLTGQNSPLLLGAIFSLAGPVGGNAFDMGQVAAVRVAIDEINTSGGGNDGRPFGVVFCDNDGPDNNLKGEARAAKNRALLDYLSGVLGVPAIVGPLSSNDATILIGHMLANDYPTLFMSPSATSPALTDQPDRLDDNDDYGLFWRSCPSDSLQGQVLANNVVGTDITIHNVAVVYIQDPYGQGLNDVFTKAYIAGAPMRTVKPIPYDAAGDYAQVASVAAANNPDAIVIIAVQASDTVAILQQLASAGLSDKKYFFTDGSKDKAVLLDNPALSNEVRSMISGARGTGPPTPVDNPSYQQFDAALFKDFNIHGDDFSFLANSYDAAYLVALGAVFASSGTNLYDGRDVAAAYSRIIAGDPLVVGATNWGSAKAALTGGDTFNLLGISGALDFVLATGEAPGPVEVWKVNAGYTAFEEDFTVFP